MLRGTGMFAHHPHLYTSGGARTDLCGSTSKSTSLLPPVLAIMLLFLKF